MEAMEAAMGRMASIVQRKEEEIGVLKATVNAECLERSRLLAHLASFNVPPPPGVVPSTAPPQHAAGAGPAVGAIGGPGALRVEDASQHGGSPAARSGADAPPAPWQGGMALRQPGRRRGALNGWK
jgi:hypothetical protein